MEEEKKLNSNNGLNTNNPINLNNGLNTNNPINPNNGLNANNPINPINPNNGLNANNPIDLNNGLNANNTINSNNGLNVNNPIDPNNGLNVNNPINSNNGLNVNNPIDLNNGLNTNNPINPNNGLNTNNQNNSNKKKIIIIVSIILALLICIVVVYICLFNNKDTNIDIGNATGNSGNVNENSENTDGNSENTDENLENDTDDIENTTGNVIKIYKINDKVSNELFTYRTAMNDDPVSIDKEMYVAVLYSEYKCKTTSCKVMHNSYDNYLLIYDGKYYAYNYKTKKVVNSFDMAEYDNVEVHYLEKNSKLIALIIVTGKDEEYKYAYYDLEKQKFMIDFGKFGSIWTDDALLSKNYVYYTKDYEYTCDADEKVGIYDFVNDKVITTGINSSISNGQTYYFSLGSFCDGDTDYLKIYDSNFKLIYSENKNKKTSTLASVNTNGNITISEDNQFKVYDKTGKKVYESKKYNEIYQVVKDYIIVNDDNNLNLVDPSGNIVTNFVNLTKDMYVHSKLSGWYTQNGKNGIYVVVADKNVKYGEWDEKTKEEMKDFVPKNTPADTVISTIWEEEETLGPGYEYYYIPSTKETGKIASYIGGYAKPVLYLYPTKDNTNIKVTFAHPELLTTTYPKFSKEWSVIANKNGDLYDKNGRYYYGLYWEEAGNTKVDYTEGFYVTKENAIKFLEEKLDQIGLNEREANEFIMYWLPILEKNGKSLVYFELTEQRQKYNELKISPKPDSILRVAIHVKKVNKEIKIKPQTFKKFNRVGFTAVEWGGTID